MSLAASLIAIAKRRLPAAEVVRKSESRNSVIQYPDNSVSGLLSCLLTAFPVQNPPVVEFLLYKALGHRLINRIQIRAEASLTSAR
jgi:hypothetical protein